MADNSTEDRVAMEYETLLAPIIDAAYRTAYRMTCNRDEAEDLVQEAALQSFRAFGSFVPDTNFKAWFFKILLNCFRGRCRKRKREPQITPLTDVCELYLYIRTAGAGLHGPLDNPSVIIINRMSEEQIEAAIKALPEEYRAVAVLYFLEEITYQEIADILDCPVGTVRSRLHRARKLLQKALWDLAASQHILSEIAAPIQEGEART